MLTLLVLLIIGLVFGVVGGIIKLALKATWGIFRLLVSVLLFPAIVLFALIKGLYIICFVLIIIGAITVFRGLRRS